MKKLIIMFIFMVQPVFAISPHYDELSEFIEVEQIRKISSTLENGCISNRAFGCMQYMRSLSKNVIRISTGNYTFDIRLRVGCNNNSYFLQSANKIELKNVHLDKDYSAIADVFIDGISLNFLCSKRVPSSLVNKLINTKE